MKYLHVSCNNNGRANAALTTLDSFAVLWVTFIPNEYIEA